MLNNIFNFTPKTRRKPLFSFVILTWNRYKFLEKCIHSLLNSLKDANDYEIIVMNNGSNDLTKEILTQYQEHPSIRIIHKEKKIGLPAYKELIEHANGKYIAIVDDDVLAFPGKLDKLFLTYMNTYKDYGFIALNVVQTEFTDGAKPGDEFYTRDVRGALVIENGPTGGWCTCFRRKDYNKIRGAFLKANFDMRFSEDGLLSKLFFDRLKLKSGLIQDAKYFHACGPYYALQYGHLDRELEKYESAGLSQHYALYRSYQENHTSFQ